MGNLIVDKPSPITIALAQKSDKDGMFAFGGENVTRGNLKNLIVDKPSPITVALAQASGVPVHVNPVTLKDTMGEAKLDMKMLIGPDEVEVAKKHANHTVNATSLTQIGNPVENPPYNNWSVNQPSGPHAHGL